MSSYFNDFILKIKAGDTVLSAALKHKSTVTIFSSSAEERERDPLYFRPL